MEPSLKSRMEADLKVAMKSGDVLLRDTLRFVLAGLKNAEIDKRGPLSPDEAQAFLLTAAAFPSHFTHPETIRLFLERYRQLHRDAAIEKVGYWKVDSFSVVSARTARERTGDNADTAIPDASLKAS